MRTPCVPALLVVAAWGLPLAAQAPRGQPSIRALMEAYQAGDYGGVARDLKRVTDLEAFGRKIVSDTWSLRVSRGSAFEPQLVVAAAVALEAVQLHGQAHRAEAAALIEIACSLVRLNEDREEVERLWHWAAVALLEGIADGEALEVHVCHALRRFPDDPAFVMANAVAVAGLTSDQFELLDTGVPQVVRLVSMEAVPLDVTVVIDTSCSISASTLAQFQWDVAALNALLERGDRLRALTFASRVVQTLPMLHVLKVLPTEPLATDERPRAARHAPPLDAADHRVGLLVARRDRAQHRRRHRTGGRADRLHLDDRERHCRLPRELRAAVPRHRRAAARLAPDRGTRHRPRRPLGPRPQRLLRR